MNVDRTKFREEDIERYGMGAGVIPFAYDDKGTLHFLMGRERWLPQWKGSCRWSGFEGSRKDTESLLTTATREFVEESLGVVCDGPTTYKRLNERSYWIRVVLKIQNERCGERYHTTYLLPIEWDPSIPNRFHSKRLAVENVDRIVQEWKYMRPKLLGDMGDEVGPITPVAFQTTAVVRLTRNAPCILRSPWELKQHNPDEISAIVSGQDAKELDHWSNVRNRLTRSLEHCDHECLQVRRDAHWNIVQDVRVIKDHLEKDQVRWWTVDDLHSVLDGRGQFGVDRFRPYFLPVLQTILQEVPSLASSEHLGFVPSPSTKRCEVCDQMEQPPPRDYPSGA